MASQHSLSLATSRKTTLDFRFGRCGVQYVSVTYMEHSDNNSLAGDRVITTRKTGIWLLHNPSTNQGQAFDYEQRNGLHVRGMLPYAVSSIDDQVNLVLEQLRVKESDLEKYIHLASLHDRNEVLFYRVLVENLAELMPIVYTPTVGEACQKFSRIVRSPRGVWLTPDDVDDMPAVLRNAPFADIRLIVVTDNERILGLGDQGCGGMGIPVGKLALYVAGAGIHPSKCLPISLDVGTNNPDLLDDPQYLGYPHRRLQGQSYDEFIEAFVHAVKEVFPRAIIQWEDFKRDHAFALLERYRMRTPCFNDDIQGTAAVTAAGVLARLRMTGQSATKQTMADQRLLFIGAGGACTGIARLCALLMKQDGATDDVIRRSMMTFDSRGLLHDGREGLDEYKAELAVSQDILSELKLSNPSALQPLDVIAKFKPTVLIGATAQPGLFTEEMLVEMSKHVDHPLIMPLSNPNSKAECSPTEAIRWTKGRAIVATGGPYPDVEYEGRRHVLGQSNNVFIFPGLGLGAAISEVGQITDEMFAIAARTLAQVVKPERLDAGAIYPSQNDLREVSHAIACEVVRYAAANNLGRHIPPEEIEQTVRSASWYPNYVPVNHVPVQRKG
ncbi:MAG: NAD-dependent malic enzyme [Planctomycetes bacterium]|nr:NAD-dependent malic enzyme [Planctomycetota bacterium]